jgi:uncharacterized LabA/DUF88 family protein
VNIAVAMISDAQDDNFDDAILITADSDQIPTVRYIRSAYAEKRVIVAFPPGRHSNDLAPVTSKTFHIQRITLEQSQFPEEVKSKANFILTRPKTWA